MEVERTCPICFTAFPVADDGEEREAFALHTLECTALINNAASKTKVTTAATMRSCPMCHRVYLPELAAHEIDFHEAECARVNDRPDLKSTTGNKQSGKRSRESDVSDHAYLVANMTPKVKLFPNECSLCGITSRSLLHCAGKCARSFHQTCIDEIQHLTVGGGAMTSTSSATKSANWTCAECFRGLHPCQLCGFLGHERYELVKCSLVNCGYFFHPKCLDAHDHPRDNPLVCPRHKCSVCHAVESDMQKCLSCTKCFQMTHLSCQQQMITPHGSRTPTQINGNFHMCSNHTSGTGPRQVKDVLGLNLRLHQGDIVLILEYANALLPPTAKDAAPEACNQWGMVVSVEQMEEGNQLLSVNIFSDGSIISVPNRYVLPLDTANSFVNPIAMTRECVMWHAVAELNIRQEELDGHVDLSIDTAKRDEILNHTCTAFRSAVERLSLSMSQVLPDAMKGYNFWLSHRNQQPKQYSGSGAPLYIYIDTRGKNRAMLENSTVSGHKEGSKEQAESGGRIGDHDDVEMSDAENETKKSTEDSTNQLPSSNGKQASSRAMGSMEMTNYAEQVSIVLAEIVHTVVSQISAIEKVIPSVADAADAMEINDVDRVDHHVAVSQTVSMAMNIGDDKRMWGCEKEISNKGAHGASAADKMSSKDCHYHKKIEEKSMQDYDAPKVNVKPQFTIMPTPHSVTKVHSGQMLKDDSSYNENESVQHAIKRQKLHPLSVPVPLNGVNNVPSSNFFARQKPVEEVYARKRKETRKQRVLAEIPPAMIGALEQEVLKYLESRSASSSSIKKKRSAQFSLQPSTRLPFSRPSVVLSRALGGGLVDDISRLLVSQDKRNLKCFIQADDPTSCAPTDAQEKDKMCGAKGTHSSGSFVTVDLLGVPNFQTLEMVIRNRMIAALNQSDRYVNVIFQATSNHQKNAQWFYCCYDGTRRRLERNEDWLSFCANVCHLTIVVPLVSV